MMLLVLLVALATPLAADSEGRYLFRNVMVFDGSRDKLVEADVLVAGNTIESVTPRSSLSVARDTTIIDGQGRTADGIGEVEFYTQHLQTLISHLTNPGTGGPLYSVDLRLRPYGQGGTLVHSFQNFRDYHSFKSASEFLNTFYFKPY